MNRLLIVDDDAAVTNYLTVFMMQTERFDPVVINDSREIEALLDGGGFDAILLDMDMPFLSGTDVLKLLREKKLDIPVVILTGVNDVDLAVTSLKLGAFDYLTKPVDDERLLEVLDNAILQRTQTEEIREIPTAPKREDLDHAGAFDTMPTRDPSMIRLFHQVEKMAAGDLCIFVIGESGTGKDLLARAIHSISSRREKPFIGVEVSGHDPFRFNAEFFGQARDWQGIREEQPGLLEQAAGGTIFINGVEKMGLPAQARLLRVLQEKEYYRESSPRLKGIDVRVVAASNVDLTADEHREIFSRDLLHHLMVHSVQVPPLRERKEDIQILAERMLAEHAERAGKKVDRIDGRMMNLLSEYQYRGNLQELSDIIAVCVGNAEGRKIGVDCLPSYLREKLIAGGGAMEIFRLRTLEEAKLEHVRATVRFLHDDRQKAALALDIPEEEIRKILGE